MTIVELFRPVASLQMMAYIIQYCHDHLIDLNITKLQKLMYCCYGTVLGKFNTRLIDEHPAAWRYGPVFPEALRSVQYLKTEVFRNQRTPDILALPEEVLDLIHETIECFGNHSASDLSRWTHLPGSPWSKASDNGRVLFCRLSDADVQSYFKEHVLE